MRPWTVLLLASALAGAEPYASPPGFRVPVSSIDTRAALSAVTLHRGLVIAPLGEDHGGGKGDGALAAYDLQDPTKPRKVFDSRDYRDRYHVRGGKDYLGDSSEYHHAILSGDLAIMAERRPDSAGFLIIDLAPLYDQDPATLPTMVSRYTFPGVNQSTNYDGFSFALDWAGGRYVYAPTGSHGLFVVDTEDLANPRLLAHLPNAQLANQTLRAAVALGDLLVLSPVAVNVRGGKVVVMDISDPARPSLTSTFNVDMGYQGFLYGSRFFNVATHTDGISPTRLLAWELADPRSITEQELLTTTGIKNPEYGYGKDGDLFVGHYPGAMRWSMTQGKPVLVDRIEPQDPPADDYAFISPVGSLVAVTSDHRVRSRLSFAPLDQPDRAPPTLLHARPATGATGVARTAVIGLAFSDFLDTATLDSTAIRLRKAGARTDLPVTLAHLNGVVSVAPVRALDPDTTYEVVADPARLRDQVGNPYNGERILTRFSTGAVLEPFSVEIVITAPVALGGEAVLGIRELAAPGTRLEHAWDLGDGRVTPFGPAASLRHRFTTPGNQVVTLASRRVGTTGSVRRSAVQVVYRPMAAKPPISSGTIDLDPTGATAFVVNPDHGSVAALDTRSLTRRWEVQIGAGAAAVTIAPDGTVWATAAEADLVVALAPRDGAELCRFPLPKGADPHGVVMAGGALYVACSGLDAVLELDPASGRQLGRVSVPDPRHLAWDPRRDRLVVPRFLARGQADCTVAVVDRRSMTVVASIPLAPSPGPDGGADGRGSLNYLAAPAISPDLSQAWIPAKKDNLARGPRRDGQPLSFDHTVRSAGIRLDLGRLAEDLDHRIDFDNSDLTTAAVFSPLGNRLFVASLGSRVIFAVDAEGNQDRFAFDAGGEGPIGLAIAPDGRTLYVHHLLSRSVAAIDVAGMVEGNGLVGTYRSVSTAATEVLAPYVLAGKKLFHDTTRREVSQEGYMSCASCHIDGGHDGRVWDLSQFGEGLRNTIDLRGKTGTGHGPLHWSGNFDEVQDFEGQIRAMNQGAGLLHDHLLAAHGRAVEAPDRDPKAGLSQPLDQLAAYVASLSKIPANPSRAASGLSPAARRGREHFIALDCMACHRGPTFTDSAPGVRHDVGTLTSASGQRLGRALDGLDTPTLLSLDRSAPYLHDGSAATLEEVLTTRNAAQQHGRTATLTATQRAELVAFLKELAPEDAPTLAEVAPGQAPPTFTAGPTEILLSRELPPGTVLGTYAATDPDPGQKVHFRLLGPDAAYASIDDTGTLRWTGRLTMRSSLYRVTIVAEDDGRIPSSTSRIVTLRLTPPAPPSISLAKDHTLERPRVRIAWIHQPGVRRYRLESAPTAAGPFREFANRRFDYQDLGREIQHIADLKALRNGTWVRVVREGLDDAGARLDTPSEALAVPSIQP